MLLALEVLKYAFMIIDDFTRFRWVLFLAHKNEAFHEFSKLLRHLQNEKGYFVTSIRSDHGTKFEIHLSCIFVKNMTSHIIFRLLTHLDKMGL